MGWPALKKDFNFNQFASKWDRKPGRRDRALAVAAQLRRQVSLTSSMHILEFGCGTGLLGFHLVPYVSWITFADTAEGMIHQVAAKIRDNHVRNADTFCFNDARPTLPRSYHGIISLLAMHHIPAYDAAIEMLAKHLKENGWLGIADLDPEDGSFHGEETHVPHQGINRQEIHRLFYNFGLTRIRESAPYVVKKKRNNTWKEFPIFLITGEKYGS
jgi:2-polyprenyl-3-methyl-5-hydroxy-6-metoxy-1,4-benzoquinol methylase